MKKKKKNQFLHIIITLLIACSLLPGCNGIDFEKYANSISDEDIPEITGLDLNEIVYELRNDGTGQSAEDSGVSLEEAKLLHVVDGDTLYVEAGGKEVKIRLIGIDTPESVHEDESKNTVYGTYASDYTKQILENVATVYLEYDKDTEDDYGRTLAYIWLSDDTGSVENMLNAILLRDGYAMDKVFMPNDKYAVQFSDLREEAESAGSGLWADEEFHALWEG